MRADSAALFISIKRAGSQAGKSGFFKKSLPLLA
jgi:hypothetical protein